MSENSAEECCPRFNPEPWDDKMLTWENRLFVKDHVTSIFHIPLNFGAVMKRNVGAIEAADAMPETPVVLSDENSLWGADVYIEVTRTIPGANMASISGTFLSKVFEGPFQNMGKWVAEMKTLVGARGKTLRNCISSTRPVRNARKSTGKTTLLFWRRCEEGESVGEWGEDECD